VPTIQELVERQERAAQLMAAYSTFLTNKQAIYYDAFYRDLAFWEDTPFELEVENLTYQRALNCMMRDNEHGEYQRRKLLYHYMKAYFVADDWQSTINKLFSSFPTDNTYLIRAINNICTLYSEVPTREIKIKDSEQDDVLNALNNTNYEVFVKKLYTQLKLTNRIAVRPIFRTIDDEIKVEWTYLTADKYRCDYDEYGNITKIWIPRFTYKPNDINATVEFKTWDVNNFQILNDKLEVVESVPNEYKKIPYIELTLDDNQDDEKEIAGGTKWELVRAQLDVNFSDTLSRQIEAFAGFEAHILVDLLDEKVDKLQLGPGSSIVTKTQMVGDVKTEPHIQTIGADTTFLSLDDIKEKRIRQALYNQGLSPAIVNNDVPLPESGTALKEMRRELLEVRQQDIQAMKFNETRMIKLFIHIWNTDSANRKPKFRDPSLYEIFIDYVEQGEDETYEEMKIRVDTWKDNGFITPVQYYRTLTNDESITDQDELLKMVKDNKELWNQLEEENGAEETARQSNRGIEQAGESEPTGEGQQVDNAETDENGGESGSIDEGNEGN
jgi:hypothetical protein